MDPAALLEQNKAEIKKRLAAISPEAKDLVEQLERTELYMAPMLQPTGKYAGYSRARDAIKDLLTDKGYPLDENAIKDEIVNRGGWIQGRGDLLTRQKYSRMMVKKSLKGHLPGHDGYKNFKLKFKNGLYGLEEWPDSLFKSR